ncbi:MAG: DNA polymerase I [Acidimicrobiia bacterium]|nr:DNA polymerase I [Acidimicrobiia bacterium]
MTTWLVVDGNSLTYRAFHALPTDIATSSGQVTNAVYGFTSMLVNLLRDHQPDRVLVAFDRPEPTFRHEQLPSYKAQREAAPDILRQQMGLVRQMVEAFGIAVVESPGFEADDILATVATKAATAGDDVLIVTGDRDAYQLVADPHVAVLYTHSRGVSELKRYDEAAVAERTGVAPSDYVTYAALRGDPSDNLPGVPGVGEKTAAKLVNAYGDLDGIFAHVADQSPKLAANLAEHEEQVRRNAELMALVHDAPLDVTLEDVGPPAPDAAELDELFTFLEFRSASLRERLDDVLSSAGVAVVPAGGDHPTLAATVEQLSATRAVEVLGDLAGRGSEPLSMAAAWEGDPGRSPLVGLALAADPDAVEVAWLEGTLLADPAVVQALGALLGPGGRGLVAHDAKPLMRTLAAVGVSVRALVLDTAIAAYLLDPGDGRYPLEEVLARYGTATLPEAGAAASGQLDFGAEERPPEEAVGAVALAVHHLVEPLRSALDARGLRALNDEVEVPLVRILAEMEHVGVGVDVDALRTLRDDLVAEAELLTRQIWEDAGGEFNVNSTPQLREVLYERLGLTPQRKTKTGYSTDAATLEKLRGEHPVVEHLLRYREVEKLRSTYAEGLLAEVADDGRIHATFHQTVARTGRLSSEHPNLHNIPVRTEEGRAFRKAFRAAPGSLLVVADYNQIELRCIAHLADDPGLVAAFEAGTDIHAETAARIFGVSIDEVDPEQRSQAKMVSYGLAYGMEAYGLGQRLGIPTGEAQTILDAYFEAFPAVADYMERTVAEARERGYTTTLFGRRRQIPELSSSNTRLRQAGERQAMNAGIQGLAADIFKVALVRIDEALPTSGELGRLILQVHDEVIVEAAAEHVDEVSETLRTAMASAFDLRVPLEVHLAAGTSWADAKA